MTHMDESNQLSASSEGHRLSACRKIRRNGLASAAWMQTHKPPASQFTRACCHRHRLLVESWQILVDALNATTLHALSCCRTGMNVSTEGEQANLVLDAQGHFINHFSCPFRHNSRANNLISSFPGHDFAQPSGFRGGRWR